jgi:hypothetical protein
LDQRQLDEALDACQQALTLDESHAGALDLEEAIRAAISIRDGIVVAADDAIATRASDPASPSPGLPAAPLLQSQAVTRLTDDPFAVGGRPSASDVYRLDIATPAVPEVAGVSEQTVLRPAVLTPPPDATIVAPARRTPAPASKQTTTQAASPAPPAPVAKAQAPTKSASGPVKKASLPNVLDPVMQSIAAVLESAKTLTSGLGKAAPRGGQSTGRRLTVWISGGVAALVLVVGVTAYVLTRGPAPTGTAIVDAVPWANITSIQSEGGAEYPLPTPASTPVALALPEGTYKITLAGPAPESKTETVTVRVDVGGTSVVPITRFQSMTVEQYFEQYLGSTETPSSSSTPDGPAPAAAVPAAPAASPGVAQ